MKPDAIADQAQLVFFLLSFRVIDGERAIAWADSSLVELESPPYSLVDLSLIPPDQLQDIVSHLRQMSEKTDFWAGMRRFMPLLRRYIEGDVRRADNAAHYLNTIIEATGHAKVPDDFHFAYGCDDAFDLARDEIIGNLEEAYRNFIRELEKFPDWEIPARLQRLLNRQTESSSH